MTLYRFFRAVSGVMSILEIMIFVYALLSWLSPSYRLYTWFEHFLEPILRPFRALNELILGRFHLPIDFSCLIAILTLQLANSLWMDILYRFLRMFRR